MPTLNSFAARSNDGTPGSMEAAEYITGDNPVTPLTHATHPSCSSKILRTIWKDVLPISTVMRCSYFIVVICTSMFGFQKDATIVAVDHLALSAAAVACLESAAALFFGFLLKARVCWVDASVARTNTGRGDKISEFLHLVCCGCFLVACASLAALFLRIIWHACPYVSLGMFGSWILTVIVSGVVWYRLM
ncbi:hypothetical protein BOTBODRAFT_183659 [Botryobasidium botryosum FD-172 SS1]|uniref:Transmembrane protein n=1 Tax=Botryobasidium botryosum (strain FD-172 SS1) TaxID=930990 RepID=A0A067NA32_BOTB1|nr:hypothetical protein BOTBODRAFT_183659 [Botryobasidium botryosum FD-172 SS1]